MKVTAPEEYGLRCLLQLARHAAHPAPVTVREVAALEGLSPAYAEKLLRLLSRAGLAQSSRGTRGGYRIALPAEQISVGDVVRALGGFVTREGICEKYTGNEEACVHLGDCGLRPIWTLVNQQVERFLDKIPLSTLLQPEERVQLLLEEAEIA